ncbi:MAG TPA: YqzE family protein [Bacillus bacterium]|nr:YqzE family protein [Bacillus sp. (in: firmicutes)]
MKGCVVMSTDDYVKFMAETLIQRLETPKSERRKQRNERKQMRAPFLVNWFGMVPFSLFIWYKKGRRMMRGLLSRN